MHDITPQYQMFEFNPEFSLPFNKMFRDKKLTFTENKDGPEHKDEHLIYQIFMESIGFHLEEKDRWEEELLLKFHDQQYCLKWNTDEYCITGVPFYNSANENEFIKELQSALDIN